MKISGKRIYAIHKFFKEHFSLNRSKENELITIERIQNGLDFKGPNLWLLIFGTFIASLGLNVNSTAVVIGAMLISPLMGPIMGVGLAMGISNFELMKRSLKSYTVVTLFSIITATIYFFFSPINHVQSELQARTSPSVYDVFIAFVGGLAGIVAVATKEKGNVIPGVAIATALMPPLCTAGFGLATGNMQYFGGAIYLYFINSVFIAYATYLGVRFLHFRKKQFVDKSRERLVRCYITLIAVVTMCPTIYLTVVIVRETIFERNAKEFIAHELNYPQTKIISSEILRKEREIRVILIGQEISEQQLDSARQNIDRYKLNGTRLLVYQRQGSSDIELNDLREEVTQAFHDRSNLMISRQQAQIDSLNDVLQLYTRINETDRKLASEMKALFPQVGSVALTQSVRYHTESLHPDTVAIAIISSTDSIPAAEQQRIRSWLQVRTGRRQLRLLME